MKFAHILVVSLLVFGINKGISKTTPSKSVHQQMHSQLLANAKSSIDKSVINDYLKLDIDSNNIDPVYGNLSDESIEMIEDLISEAHSHSGKKYRRGAKGPSNFDCSGFTGYVYKQFGYKLGASSSNQYSDGIVVEKGDLRPGDLVFFTSPRSRGGVGHVGIVIEADNEHNTFSFIHAAISGGIQVDKSTSPYYQKRYVGARRIITE